MWRSSEGDDLSDGKVNREWSLLPHQGDLLRAVAGGPALERATDELESAGVGQQSDQRPQQRRFSRAVGSDQRNAFASSNLEGDVAQDRAPPQRHTETLGIEKRRDGGHGDELAVRSGDMMNASMLRPIRFLVGLTVVLSVSACSAFDNEAQRSFENAAFLLAPEGYTRVSEQGDVGQEDPNDWLAGPAFVGRASVLTPPYPNPAPRDATVRLLMDTNGVAGGLALYTIDARGDLRLLDERPDATDVGFYELAFFGSQAAAGGGDGLYRLVVLDGNQRVVTYGDLLVQG